MLQMSLNKMQLAVLYNKTINKTLE